MRGFPVCTPTALLELELDWVCCVADLIHDYREAVRESVEYLVGSHGEHRTRYVVSCRPSQNAWATILARTNRANDVSAV